MEELKPVVHTRKERMRINEWLIRIRSFFIEIGKDYSARI